MRFVSYRIDGRPGYGLVNDGGIVDLTRRLGDRHGELAGLIASGDLQEVETFTTTEPDLALDAIDFDLPVPRPGKILCVGVNYVDRNAEYKDGSDQPSYPSLFMRTPGSLAGHHEPILRPPESEQFDYEGEIVMVIGKAGRRIPEDKAEDHVFGLTIMNEGSIRDWMRHGKFNVTQGKNFERSGALGPWITTRDETPAFDNLNVITRVNGEERQNGHTADLLFPFSRLIAYISTFMELHPGDVISTGTPTGSGIRLDPPQFLKPGDTVEVEVPGIGTLTNTVADEQA
ncbi:MAG: fumarylacetoacetate hydrolase family protein [Pseudomonadota bacterium]